MVEQTLSGAMSATKEQQQQQQLGFLVLWMPL
jgi:hypothetical protein